MKIFGICLVKNEEDIIAHSLRHHTSWADHVFVYDNGSTDRTWKIVQEEAQKNPKIIPFKSAARPFRDGLRAEVFNAYKHLAEEGDWWCVRCDSDEIYMDDPREFLQAVPRKYQVVLSLHYEYQLAKEDLKEINFQQPIEKILPQIKFYHPKATSETRFIKHRRRLTWDGSSGFPRHKGVIFDKKIRLKHYQYRTPEQIKKRIEVRKQARAEGHPFFKKDNVNDWKDIILPRAQLIKESEKMQIGYLQDKNDTTSFRYRIKALLHTLGILP